MMPKGNFYAPDVYKARKLESYVGSWAMHLVTLGGGFRFL
ncbi:hypothetical protein NC652_028113 [Populus alba x Populus x berolinensis]|nr:hypothetical protein NC652_028113 [Populus alba x Populus x berolinensis]